MIVLIGPLPPPVHGESLITERVRDRLINTHVPCIVCDTSPILGSRSFKYFYSRIVAYLRSCRSLYRARPHREANAVYLALSSGLGLIAELVVVLMARLMRYDFIFHHHSFSYLSKPNLLLRAIVFVAGKRQFHVALCSTMATKLRSTYGTRIRTEIVSNIGLMELPGAAARRRQVERCAVIGYLSNVSLAKGIDRYLDLIATLRSRGSTVRGLIAGPFDVVATQTFVERRIAEIGGIDYLGPVYGDRKAAFLASIDLLMFPSRYTLEAQPLVVFEAQAAGVPVAASKRGCVADQSFADPALLLDPAASDLDALVKRILQWEKDPATFREVAQAQCKLFDRMVEQSVDEQHRFDALMSSYE